MARPLIDLTGRRYGRWTVLGIYGIVDNLTWKDRLWKCRCDCGTEGLVRGNALRQGTSKSCGCLKDEIVKRKRVEGRCMTN